MQYAFKYNTTSRGKEGNNNTWILYQNFRVEENETIWDKEILVDHIEFKVPVFTIQKDFPDFGFGMKCKGELQFRQYPKNPNKQFAIIVAGENDVEAPDSKGTLYSEKYHVPSRGLMQNNSWRTYVEIDEAYKKKDYSNTIYTDEVQILAASWTGETTYGVGYSLITKGQHFVDLDPETDKPIVIIEPKE